MRAVTSAGITIIRAGSIAAITATKAKRRRSDF
jgi:hypothetical protein